MSDSVEKKADFIREIIKGDLASGKHDTVLTRFPPEPNGYLHLGHAKSMCLNFGLAQEYAHVGAQCRLRFDDTNPAKEGVEFVNSILEDVRWLGYSLEDEPLFASDYFEYFYDCAIELIQKGLAYVDEEDIETMRAKRGSVTQDSEPSIYRERTIEENLAAFAKMRAGDFAQGEAVLRAKISLTSSNMNMRDPVLYRVLHEKHHHTTEDWCIYPTYDYAHCLEDAKEGITHSLCTLEFENHRPIYNWVVENCTTPSKPRQIEFSRLNLTYTVLSKRKLAALVDSGVVSGWDDPRMPTLAGVRRRGYPAQAIKNFCQSVGVTKFNGMTDVTLLENEVRSQLNTQCLRKMAVLDPLKVVLTNLESEELVSVVNHPENPELGSRDIALTPEIYIERDDFMIDAPKKYFRLKPEGAVRLRGGYIIVCKDYALDAQGKVETVYAEIIPGTIGNSPPEGIKCKAAIHWVSATYALDATVNIYDRLFNVENPDADQAELIDLINPDSLQVLTNAKLEPSLTGIKLGDKFQFERLGYFGLDTQSSASELILNRIASLRDSWAKRK